MPRLPDEHECIPRLRGVSNSAEGWHKCCLLRRRMRRASELSKILDDRSPLAQVDCQQATTCDLPASGAV
jgi:hypothetical protein